VIERPRCRRNAVFRSGEDRVRLGTERGPRAAELRRMPARRGSSRPRL